MKALALVAVVLVAGGAAAPAARPKPSRPNIVVIMTDDQTVAQVRAMPNVGHLLAAHGTTFLNSFVANSLCCPSRVTFLTGQYSHNNGVWDNEGPTGGWDILGRTQANTLPAWLHAAGYATIFVGKYVNGYGDDELLEVPTGWSDWHAAVDLTWRNYYGFTLNENGRLVRYPHEYQTDVYAEKAATAIRRYAGARQPFFLWLCFLAPHTGRPDEPGDPVGFHTAVPAPQDRDRFDWLPLPKPPSYNEADVSDKPRDIQRRPLIDYAMEATLEEAYQQQLESLLSVDRAVARVVGTLRQSHALGNTVIVFTSDNGYLNGEHRVTDGKELPYEPSIEVPLIVRGPGVARHRVSRSLVSNVDLASTFVELAGAQAGRPQDGRSLVPLLRKPGLHWQRDLLIESPRFHPDQAFTAIRTERSIWIEYRDGDREQYDLVKDPYELASVHADPRYAPVRRQLARKLAQLRRCRGASCRT